jgi:hypothetical protein
MNFTVDVTQWVKKTKTSIEELRKNIIIELFSSVILDTPVDTGRLRGNWIISMDNPITQEVRILDPSGNETVKKVHDLTAQLPQGKDKTVFLTNNLPYAYRIEYDGWSHTKAPRGMVRKNFIRVSQNLKKVA